MPSLRFIVGFFLLALLIGSCSEHVPVALPSATPPAIASDFGLDVRPVSATCKAVAKPAPPAAPKATVAYQKLTNAPLANLVEIIVHGGRTYVVDRSGIIRYLASDGMTAPVVLDLRAEVGSAFGYDSGIVSMAFHPNFAQNGFIYLAYMVPYPVQPPPPDISFLSVVGRFQSKDGGLTIDPTTEKRLLVRDQPGPNHNGNKVLFGPDGLLYFSAGEGGVDGNAQDKNALFGKILRIDVDKGDPYAIPPSNVFAQGGGAPEIYAYGFRNPWRFSIDAPTGDMWVGDVGATAWEEIDRVVSGGNYGWPIVEGNTCYKTTTCDRTGLLPPLVVHPHSEATAIIGGSVYRGSALPALVGKYVYADYTFASFWSLDPLFPVPTRLDVGLDRINITTMGVDEKGELLFCTATDAYRLVPPPPVLPEMPAKLSDTGCVDKADPTKPAAGLFPYDVNAAQWSDGAIASRFLAVPGNAKVAVVPGLETRLDLPVGSVAMRTLKRESRLVETQLLLRRPDSESLSAYTYAWSADQKDAALVTAPTSVKLPSGQDHHIDPLSCTGCHDPHKKGVASTIGLAANQLDGPKVDYGGGRMGNPLATLAHVGMLSTLIPQGSYVPLSNPAGYDSLEPRARGYLHANCAFCHDGIEFSGIDLRSFVALHDTKICGVNGTGLTAGNKRVAPGDPNDSQLVTSMRATDAGRMPPVGTTLIDPAGIELLSTWITSIANCP